MEDSESRSLSNNNTKKYHPSWLIAWLGSGIIVGTYLSLYIVKCQGIEWLVVCVCLGLVGFVKNKSIGILLVILSGLIFGLWRGSNVLYAYQSYEQYQDQRVRITGVVVEDITYAVDGGIRFKLKNIAIEGELLDGVVWVASSNQLDIKRSDIVELEGMLSDGFGNIPASVYRADILRVERPDYADVARDVRDSFAEGIREGIKEPEASLGAGFLLGQKTALPEKLDIELRLLGLTHIVVASGYNLTILIRFARRLFVKISRFSALALSAGLVYCFALVTGFSPSMTRAGIIAFISLLAWYYGRKLHPFVLLSFSAALTVIINPTYAWGDIGWLLSFTSFIGVIVLSPLIHAYFWGDKKPGNVRQVVIETLSAQLLTLPIIAYVFGQFSPLALPANVLILPLIPLAMVLTFMTGITGVIAAPAAFIVGWPAQIVMGYMTAIVGWLAQSPFAGFEVTFTSSLVIVSYIVIFVAIMFLHRRTKYEFRDYNVIE